jgi:hypothetical protein
MSDPTVFASSFIHAVTAVVTNPYLLGLLFLGIFVAWYVRGWMDKIKVENAEGGEKLFQKRYELEKESHAALRDQVAYSHALQVRVVEQGPKEVYDLLLRLAAGEQIHTTFNPVYVEGQSVGTLFFHNPEGLKKFAALANTTASGFATTIASTGGGYTTTATPKAFMFFGETTKENQNDRDGKNYEKTVDPEG